MRLIDFNLDPISVESKYELIYMNLCDEARIDNYLLNLKDKKTRSRLEIRAKGICIMTVLRIVNSQNLRSHLLQLG